MLHTPVDGIELGEDGKVKGVKSGDQVARAPVVIGDPSYFPDRCKPTGRVVRVICLLDHPVNGTGGLDSVQIIIPQNQVKRKNGACIVHRASWIVAWCAVVWCAVVWCAVVWCAVVWCCTYRNSAFNVRWHSISVSLLVLYLFFKTF